MVKKQKGQKNPLGEITRDYTINLHKRIHKQTFKRRAPRAVSEIIKFGITIIPQYEPSIKARKNMLTDDVRVDPQLNEAVWLQGVRNVPNRIRVRLSRRKKEEDDGKGKYYTFAQHVPIDSFKGLKTELAKDQ